MMSHFINNRRESGISLGGLIGEGPFRGLENRGSCCLIVFDRPTKVYWSGDILSGKVIVLLKTDKTIQGKF